MPIEEHVEIWHRISERDSRGNKVLTQHIGTIGKRLWTAALPAWDTSGGI